MNKRHGTDVKELGASINNNAVRVHENPFEAHRKTVETKSRNSLLKLSSVSVNYYIQIISVSPLSFLSLVSYVLDVDGL